MRAEPRRDAILAGVAAVAAVVGALALDPTATVELFRARVFDAMLDAIAPRGRTPRIVVIDIDSSSLEQVGPWPWRRERIAALIDAARAAGAAAIGVDILFAAPEMQSPAALARRLASETRDARVGDLAASLIDDDARLAQSLTKDRVVLGFALSLGPEGSAPAGAPILARGRIDLGAIWSGGGVYPIPALAANAAFGALSLAGDADGIVRRAPLLVATSGVLRPGLALETLRLARGGGAYLLEDQRQRVVSGMLAVALTRDGELRLAPAQPVETISAADWLSGKRPASLIDAVVFIGASAPEAGGLRATARDPLTPSVAIQAQAARQIALGWAPLEAPPWLAWSVGSALALALIGLAAFASEPVAYGVALATLAAVFAGAAATTAAQRLIDPVEIAAPALAGFAAAAAVMGAAARRRARFLRARFERHLAPQVIARIVANSDAPKLVAERREITALFTDIEGFTGMVGRAPPAAMVAALDGYFEGMTEIALAHGGLMDKFVGDACDVFFNMPFDLDAHATRALDCAEAMARWSEAFRREPGPAALGFGRTRIGIESGPALVGDIGGGAKLDYTAHGETVVAAARLEGANKQTGTAICVGPGATARIAPERLRPVGLVELRGFLAPVAAASPWPEAAAADWRTRYLAAFALRESEPAEAARAFAALAAEIGDPVAAKLAAPQ